MLRKFILSTLVTFLPCFLFIGCDRNSTFQNSITFTGKVYVGHLDTTTNILITDHVQSGAIVTCTNYPGSVKTASDGSYTLGIKAMRTFSGINLDSYSIQATYGGDDETITATGKPGDTIQVRDFVLYQHTITSAPRRTNE